MEHVKAENIIVAIERILDYVKRIEIALNRLGLDKDHSILKNINNAKGLSEEIKKEVEHANKDFHNIMREIISIYDHFLRDIAHLVGTNSEIYRKLEINYNHLTFLSRLDLHNPNSIIKATSSILHIEQIIFHYARGNRRAHDIFLNYANIIKNRVSNKLEKYVIDRLAKIEKMIKELANIANSIFKELASLSKNVRYQAIYKEILVDEKKLREILEYLNELSGEIKLLITSLNRMEQALIQITYHLSV